MKAFPGLDTQQTYLIYGFIDMKRLILLILSMTLLCEIYGRVYYVSSAGNDSNSGLSESLAWQTLSRVQSASFVAGDTILFRCGDTFRGSLYKTENGNSSAWIIYSSYGSGNKPLIIGSKDISSPSDWNLSSGNIWRTSATLGTNQNDISNIVFNNENSVGYKQNSLASCDSQGDFFYNTSDNLLYMFSASNPGTYYTKIEACGHHDIHQGLLKWHNSSYIAVENLDVRYSSAGGIEFGESHHFRVKSCHLAFIGGEWFNSANRVRLGNGISMVNNVSYGEVCDNYVRDCYDAGISPQGWRTDYVQQNINQHHNIILRCYYSYEGYGAGTGQSMINVNFYNNTCIDAGSCWSNNADQRSDYINSRHVMIWKETGTNQNCNIKNNIFSGTCVSAIRINRDGNYDIKHVFDYNLYNVSVICDTYGGILNTLADWQNSKGQDLHSISGNPLFAETVNYTLSSSSPAIDAGIDVGFPYKALAPDIGAKEFSNYVTYYVSQSGLDDASRNGSIGQEWATLSYACSRVTRAGDTIRVTAGNYNETAQCNLSAGVSIRGAGRTTTKITATSSLTRLIYASSNAGTNGNQLISDITFDFNMNASFGVQFFGRSNVIIERTGFENAIRYGLTIADVSGRSGTTEPTSWAKNNIIRNSHFINCGTDTYNVYTWEADGAIDISGQENMLIYGNDIDNKTGGRYAYGIKGLFCGGFFKGLKIYDNKIRTNIRDVSGEQSFGFNIELWTGVGGNEVYHNDCNGCIDLGGYGWWDSCGYGYAIKVYENIVIQDVRPTNQPEAGLILESGGKDGCYFYRNWVENFTTGFTLGTTANSIVQGYDGVWVTYNIFCNIGYATGGVGAGIGGYNLSSGVTIKNYNVLNNVIHKVNNSSGWGISYEYATANNWENVNLENNIIFNAYTPIQFRNQTVTSMYIHNNLTYGATRTISHSDSWANSTITLREILNNLENTNPLFNSVGTDFSLQSNSPCINTGTYVGLTRDFYNRRLVGVPDIGAIEYGAIGGINFGKNRQGVMLKGRNWKMMIYN